MPVSRFATVELHKEELKFSAGHFMIFSATQRENMHGHDYQVSVAFDCTVGGNGMSFDCRHYKQRVLKLCQQLDYRFILPSQSDYLRLEETADKWLAHVCNEVLPFLKKDAIVLPISNATLEELSNWFLHQLTVNAIELVEHQIHAITVRVFNGRGESGASYWRVA
jgi:6-pyruvoyltetrahydropterin/6-carboxytetrahydropterin synthase